MQEKVESQSYILESKRAWKLVVLISEHYSLSWHRRWMAQSQMWEHTGNLPIIRHALWNRKQGRHIGEEVLWGLRKEGKDTVIKRDELRGQGPLGMKSGGTRLLRVEQKWAWGILKSFDRVKLSCHWRATGIRVAESDRKIRLLEERKSRN